MTSLVVSRLSGAGKDELTRIDSFVNCSPHMVPDLWCELPFVDEPGGVALENQARIQFGSVASSLVDIEETSLLAT
jgi:hypothetical protein